MSQTALALRPVDDESPSDASRYRNDPRWIEATTRLRNLLREARTSLGYSQERMAKEISKQLGTPTIRATYSRWETQEGAAMGAPVLLAVLDLLGIALEDTVAARLNDPAARQLEKRMAVLEARLRRLESGSDS